VGVRACCQIGTRPSLLAEWQFGIYTCTFDLILGQISDAEAKQYPYNQVAAVITSTSSVPLPPPGGRDGGKAALTARDDDFEYRELRVLASAGDYALVPLHLVNQASGQMVKSSLMPHPEGVIDAIRKALRRGQS
jgi:hypothetical protein